MALLYEVSTSAAGVLAGSAGEGESFSLMAIHPGTLIWTIIIFAVLLLVLGKLLWKPLLAAVNEREKRIRDNLERADQARKESEQALQQQKQALDEQRREASAFLARAKEEAQQAGNELLQKARQEAEEIVERSRRQIEEEKSRALVELKAQTVDLAIRAAGRLLNETLDEDSHRRIVQEYIDSLPDHLKARH